jgi:hypothetical protein
MAILGRLSLPVYGKGRSVLYVWVGVHLNYEPIFLLSIYVYTYSGNPSCLVAVFRPLRVH